MIKIDEISTVPDAIGCIRVLTGAPIVEEEFFRAIGDNALPLYAVAPFDAAVVVHSRDANGMLVITPAPHLRPLYVTLQQDEIEQLCLGGSAITNRPAWTSCEEPFVPWDEVLQFRNANHRVVNFDWSEMAKGEWMGDSDKYFFARPIGIKYQEQLRVPRHTVQELVRIFTERRQNTSGDTEPASSLGDLADERKTVAEPLAGGTPSVRVQDAAGTDDPPAIREVDLRTAAVEGGDRSPTVHTAPIRGVTKQQVLDVFSGLPKSHASKEAIDLGKALSDGRGIYGDEGARVQRGTRGGRHASLWNPLQLAVYWYERNGVSLFDLNQAFRNSSCLADWREEWIELVESMGLRH